MFDFHDQGQRWCRVLFCCLAAANAFSSTGTMAAAGDLDATFGQNGSVTIDLPAGSISGRALALQADGRIVVAGGTHWSGSGFVVVRLNGDGSPDTTFGDGGYVSTDFGLFSFATDVAIQPDGRIVVVGDGGNGDFAIARFLGNGALDPSFSGDGKATLALGALIDRVSVKLQPTGAIVISGGEYFVAQYSSDGELDATFGNGGYFQQQFTGYEEAYANAVALNSDGSILVGGIVFAPSSDYSAQDFAVAKYQPNGDLETNFGDNGLVTTDLYESQDYLNDLCI